MTCWCPPVPPSLRLWRRDPVSPKSSMWKQTVSANIFCADSSSSLGEAPSWLKSINTTQLFWARSMGLNTSAAQTETTEEDHHDAPGKRLNVHPPQGQSSNWNNSFTTTVRGNQCLLRVLLRLKTSQEAYFELTMTMISHKGPALQLTDSTNPTNCQSPLSQSSPAFTIKWIMSLHRAKALYWNSWSQGTALFCFQLPASTPCLTCTQDYLQQQQLVGRSTLRLSAEVYINRVSEWQEL